MDCGPFAEFLLAVDFHERRHRIGDHLHRQVRKLPADLALQLYGLVDGCGHGVDNEGGMFGEDFVGVLEVDREGTSSLYVDLVEAGLLVRHGVFNQLTHPIIITTNHSIHQDGYITFWARLARLYLFYFCDSSFIASSCSAPRGRFYLLARLEVERMSTREEVGVCLGEGLRSELATLLFCWMALERGVGVAWMMRFVMGVSIFGSRLNSKVSMMLSLFSTAGHIDEMILSLLGLFWLSLGFFRTDYSSLLMMGSATLCTLFLSFLGLVFSSSS